MAGIAIPQHGGRYRRAKFFVCLPPGMNRQLVLNAALVFTQEVCEFCILGRINMLPTGFFPENYNRHLSIPKDVFYFKKLPNAAIQLRVSCLFTHCRSSEYATHWAPNFCQEGLLRHLEDFCANDYSGFDQGGNEF